MEDGRRGRRSSRPRRGMILITGASGLLGAHVLLRARGLGKDALGICHRHQVPAGPTETVDLTDSAATRRLVTRVRPAAIIHCAAAADVDWCEDHRSEARRINIAASAFLAGLAC